MKTIPDYPVFSDMVETDLHDPSIRYCVGLTKREYFAAMILQGISANAVFCDETKSSFAPIAVEQADLLIAELNKEAKS